MTRYGVECGVQGHDLRHTDRPDTGERVYCVRDDCDLDVPKPAGQRCLAGAYRTWDGPQGLLEGAEL